MQPIELDGIKSGVVQSARGSADVAHRVGQRRVRLGDLVAGSLSPAISSMEVICEGPADIGALPLAHLLATIELADEFVHSNGDRLSGLTAAHDAAKGGLWLHATGGGKTGAYLGLVAAASWRGEPIARAVQRAGRLHRHGFAGALSRLESGFLLAHSLQSARIWDTDSDAGFPQPVDHEPLAIACGITRLSRPLIPRAPGPIFAAGRFGVGDHGLVFGLAA
ncbi:hypothetical protein GCM10009760_16820 [Kitasatospora kazusensis]|uniref:Uncharacterized protein n=1 Tax=Kitasatospora kazusensis TaxID=407974 RepID=A0ABN2Z569_9ACTN